MDIESGFLSQLLADPSDDATRLVCADWLDEQGDAVSAAKAEFLRVTAAMTGQPGESGTQTRKRLQELAATLDTDWLAIVSRLPIENCQGKKKATKQRQGIGIDKICDKQWTDLKPTDDRAVRFCDSCQPIVRSFSPSYRSHRCRTADFFHLARATGFVCR